MSSLKPIKLYGHVGGPNPWKVAMILEELSVPYSHEFIDFSVIKQEPYISVNPNGRVPAIEDPNTGITLWESGAIVQYLIAEYDKDHKISYGSSPNKYLTEQWLYFQTSGQGPYFGQFIWFTRFHPEKVPSAVTRYANEIARVVAVIDLHLAQTGGDWLVGDKCTYADLSFVPWGTAVDLLLAQKEAGVEAVKDVQVFENGKNARYKAWMDRLVQRDTVKKILAQKAEAGKK